MKMGFQAGVEYKGRIYFSDTTGFGLFSYDLESRKVDFCVQFEETNCFALHRKAFLYKNEAWFIPQAGRYITCVNLDDFSMQRFEVPYKKMISDPVIQLSDGIVINDMLVCSPYDIDTLVIVDLKEHRVRSYYDFIDPEKENFISLGIRNGNVCFYPFKGEEIKVVNPLEGSWETFRRNDKQFDYSEVAILDGAYLYAPGEKKEILYQKGNEVIGLKYEGRARKFFGSYVGDDKVLFFPLDGKDFLEVNTLMMQQFSINADDVAMGEDEYILLRIDSEERLLLASFFTSSVLEFCEDRTIKSYSVEADEKEIKKQIDMKTSAEEKKRVFELIRETIYHEDYKRSLEGFIGFIS